MLDVPMLPQTDPAAKGQHQSTDEPASVCLSNCYCFCPDPVSILKNNLLELIYFL